MKRASQGSLPYIVIVTFAAYNFGQLHRYISRRNHNCSQLPGRKAHDITAASEKRAIT